MNKVKFISILLIFIIGLSACGNDAIQPSELEPDGGSSLPVQSSSKDSSSDTDNTISWNPRPEITLVNTDNDNDVPYAALEQWIEAYRLGEPSQIYFVDGGFYEYRITCYGTKEYSIESKYILDDTPPNIYISSIVKEGSISYTFDTSMTNIGYQLTIWRKPSEHENITQQIERHTPLISGAITADEAESAAYEWYTRHIGDRENIVFLANEAMKYKGFYFYVLNVFDNENQVNVNDDTLEGRVAVSADGTIFLYESLIDGYWVFVEDMAAEQVIPNSFS